MAGIPSGYTPLAKIGISDKGEYVSGTTYEKQDSVLYKGSTYVALIDNPVGEPTNDGVNWRYLAKGFPDDINEVKFTFTEAESRENIETGEKSKTIFGKIRKWFAEQTAAAFAQIISSYADMMSNTVDGYLLDALAVKEGFETVNSNLSAFLGLKVAYGQWNPEFTEVGEKQVDIDISSYGFSQAPTVALGIVGQGYTGNYSAQVGLTETTSQKIRLSASTDITANISYVRVNWIAIGV